MSDSLYLRISRARQQQGGAGRAPSVPSAPASPAHAAPPTHAASPTPAPAHAAPPTPAPAHAASPISAPTAAAPPAPAAPPSALAAPPPAPVPPPSQVGPAPPYTPGPYAPPPPYTPSSSAPGPYAVAAAPPPDAPASGSDEQRRDHFRPDIEGLRAVAIIAVVLFHVGLPFADGGFVGVDVFYVISGFLITGLLLREGERSGKIDLLRFYARRIRRLLPAALVVIVVTLGLSAVILSPLRLIEVAGDAAASALYVANFRFAIEATDYLALGDESPFLHFWSLGVEEQFYLAWPLFVLLAARWFGGRLLAPAIAILLVASFGLSLLWTEIAPAWAFFSLPTRAWELAAGALIAVGVLRIPRRAPRGTATLLVLTGLGLIVASVVVIGKETPFPGLAAVLPVLGAALVIIGGLAGRTLPGRVLAHPVPRYIGRISYSLYLWHWPIIVLVPIAIGTDDLAIRVALAWVAVIVAAVSTELIEQPFRRGAFLGRRPRFSVSLGLAGSGAVAVAVLLLGGAVTIPNPFITPDPRIVQLAGVRDDLPRSYADGCQLGFNRAKPAECVYGDPKSRTTAVLFGDSHAAQWLPALDVLAQERGWRLVVHTKSACSPVAVTLWERKLRRVYDECHKWRESVLKQIAAEAPEFVFMGSSRDYELWNGGTLLRTLDVYPQWQALMAELLARLDEDAGRVVLLAETPFLNYDPVDCLADARLATCDPPKIAVIDARYAALEVAAADAAGASVLGINDLLCPGASCPVMVGQTVVFRDAHHITATHMTQLADGIGAILDGRDPRLVLAPVASSVPREAALGAGAGGG